MATSQNDSIQVSRRAFQQAAIVGGGAALLSMRSIFAQQAGPKTFPKGRYVDMHTHIGQVWNTTNVVSVEML